VFVAVMSKDQTSEVGGQRTENREQRTDNG
jgi:hypothetical protein